MSTWINSDFKILFNIYYNFNFSLEFLYLIILYLKYFSNLFELLNYLFFILFHSFYPILKFYAHYDRYILTWPDLIKLSNLYSDRVQRNEVKFLYPFLSVMTLMTMTLSLYFKLDFYTTIIKFSNCKYIIVSPILNSI